MNGVYVAAARHCAATGFLNPVVEQLSLFGHNELCRNTVLADFDFTAAPNNRIAARFVPQVINRRSLIRKSLDKQKLTVAVPRPLRWPSPMRLARLERAWA